MVDFNKIASESFLYNFHSHTQFCDGHAQMRDFVESAVNMGFTDYGFSPHSPTPFPTNCNMKQSDVDTYLKEFIKLKEEFSGKINLYKSMEIDFLDCNWGAFTDYFQNLDLDYRISSVHFIPCGSIFVDTDGCFDSFNKKMSSYFSNDIKSVVESFYNQTLMMIQHGGFDIIGHFDKISQNASCYKPGIEEEEWYEKLVRRVLDAICDTKLIVEINTKSVPKNGRIFPNQRYFHLLKKYGVPVIFNSDAHYPELINAGRKEAYEIYQMP